MQKEIHHDTWAHDLSGMGYDPMDDDIVLMMVTLGIYGALVHCFSLRTHCCVEM